MDEDDKSFLYSKSEESEERRVEANYSAIPLTNKYTQHTLIGDVSLKGQMERVNERALAHSPLGA